MKIKTFLNTVKTKIAAYSEQLEKKRLAWEEEHRRLQKEEKDREQRILSGDISQINVQFTLHANEKAYCEYPADRMATVEYTIEKTTGKTKKKGILGRAVIGAVLFGVPGAIIGGATAGSKHETNTVQEHIEKNEEIDTGKFVLTDKRILFIGNKNVVSIPYTDILNFDMNWAYEVTIKYPNMLTGELYQIRGDNRKDLELYYKGIRGHIVKS